MSTEKSPRVRAGGATDNVGGSRTAGSALPLLALLLNAVVWGCAWWPYRELQALGLHPLWATTFIYGALAAVTGASRPGALKQLMRTPQLWIQLLAAGTVSAACNWAVVIGDVVRVVLLFYLMPLWTILLARWLLREEVTHGAVVRIVMGVVGAVIVLRPEGSDLGVLVFPVPHCLPDWLGLIGGFACALSNVMLRRDVGRDHGANALAVFAGSFLVAGGLALALAVSGRVTWSPPSQMSAWVLAAAFAAIIFVSNLALQFGVERVPANVASAVLLSEVAFVAVSNVAFSDGRLTIQLITGGALIIGSSAFAATETCTIKVFQAALRRRIG